MSSALTFCSRATGALAAAVLATGCGPRDDAKAPASARPALTVTVAQPLRETLPNQLTANGNITAWQEASVGAEVAGLRLTQVNANVGDRVKKGDVLAVFSSATLSAELAQARASVAEAEAAAADAAANAERARGLQASGALSAAQINQYFTAEKTAQARAQAAQALFDSQTVRLQQAQVLAPDDGVISARSATVGAVVGAGTELFRLIRKGRLEWRAEVTSAELGRLAPGTAASVTTASGMQLAGRVRVLGATVDPQTRAALVYVDLLPQPGGGYGSARAGMFARGAFELGATTAVTVPQPAVVVREGFSYVLRVQPDNRVSAVKVATGRMVGERIEVTGLPPEARIVASGAGFLSDGDLVRVATAPASAAPARAAASTPASTRASAAAQPRAAQASAAAPKP